MVRTDRIGDVILTLPVVAVLKERFPFSRVDMLVRPSTSELVADYPHVDEIVIDDERGIHRGLRGFFRLGRLLGNQEYDTAILVRPTFRLALLLLWTGIPTRIGTGYRWYQFLFNRKIYEHRRQALRHEAEYNLNLLRPLGIEGTDLRLDISVPSHVLEKAEERLRHCGVMKNDPLVILHPGSGGSARDWPLPKFAQLGDTLMKELEAKVILTGSRDEVELVAEVKNRMTLKPLMEIHDLDLKELAALIQRVDVFVSNSTGPMHIAAAVGTPVVALFPPLVPCSPRRWGPVGPQHAVLQPKVPPCTTCCEDACQFFDCMEGIEVDEVLAAVQDQLSQMKGSSRVNGEKREKELIHPTHM